MDRPCITPRSLRRLYRVLVPGLLLRVRDCTCSGAMDLGPVNAPPPLEHRDSGVGWSNYRKDKWWKNIQLHRYWQPGRLPLVKTWMKNIQVLFRDYLKRDKMKRIKHNDLTHWFIRDHGTLPAGYLRSCEKFFKSIKQQAASGKLQAPSLTNNKYRIIKDIWKQKKHYLL